MKQEERKNRIIARGEHSNHAHIVTGDATIKVEKGETVITVGDNGATLKHLLESHWVENGEEVWTKEHTNIDLEKGTYKYIPQIEKDPYEEVIRRVVD